MTHTSTGARLAQSTGGTLADLIPFNGLVYAESLKGSIGDLTTPPYDIISKEAQKAFYEKNPNNVIRLELPMAPEPETPESNRYTRARADLDRMLSSGVLTVDPVPALYPYTMTFKDPLTGNSRKIQGFVGRIRLEEWEKKIVYPHERTLQGPKEDRMALFKATSCSFSQIYLLYPDATREIMGLLAPKSVERFRCTDSDNVLHELGAVTDAAILARVTEIFRKKSLYIADGHHRYETYLAYRNYRRSLETSPNPNAPYEFVTVFLAAMEDENLSVLPTHRLVKSIPGGAKAFLQGLESRASIERFSKDQGDRFLAALRASNPQETVIGVAVSETDELLLCRLNVPRGEGVKALDTYWLQEAVLSPLLNITPERIRTEDLLRYDKSDRSVQEKVFGTRDYALGFFIRPVSAKVIESVTQRGELMPQKSTYFYPKPLTGMVMAKL